MHLIAMIQSSVSKLQVSLHNCSLSNYFHLVDSLNRQSNKCEASAGNTPTPIQVKVH